MNETHSRDSLLLTSMDKLRLFLINIQIQSTTARKKMRELGCCTFGWKLFPARAFLPRGEHMLIARVSPRATTIAPKTAQPAGTGDQCWENTHITLGRTPYLRRWRHAVKYGPTRGSLTTNWRTGRMWNKQQTENPLFSESHGRNDRPSFPCSLCYAVVAIIQV